MTYLFQVHALHGSVHPFDYRSHAARDLSHRDRGLDPARDGIDTASQTKQIQRFRLLPDRVGSVYPCAVVVASLECLSQFGNRFPSSL